MSNTEDVIIVQEIAKLSREVFEMRFFVIVLLTGMVLMFIVLFLSSENFKPYISHQQVRSDPQADPKVNPTYSWPQSNEQYLDKYLEYNNFTEKNRSTYLPSNYVAIDNPATNYSPWDLDYF